MPIQVGFKAGWAWGWCMRSGQLQASTDCYRVLSINPKEPQATANLLVIFRQTGDFKAAQALIDALDERQRRDPDIRKSIADLKTAKGENLTASHDLKELAACYPNRAEHWLNWAASLKSLKFTVAPALILKRNSIQPGRQQSLARTRANTI